MVVDAATCKTPCRTSLCELVNTRRFVLGALGALCSLWLQAAGASAQVMPVRTSIALGAATMISKDQAGRMQYDQLGLALDVDLGLALFPFLDVQVGTLAAGFGRPTGTGGLAAPLLGLRGQLPGATYRPYLQADVGAGFTGPLTRPFMRLAGGLEVQVSRAIALGPKLGYGQLFQTNGPGDSTDARFLWLGVSLSFWPGGRVAAPAPTRIIERRHSVLRIRDVLPPPAAPATDDELDALLESAVPPSRVELLAPVLFKFDSDVLEPVGIAMLHEVARELASRKDIELLEIQGYADARGSTEYNDALSARRAERVRLWLVAHDVAPERLSVAARGATQPVEPARSAAAYEQNRRVVFRVKRLQGDSDAQQ